MGEGAEGENFSANFITPRSSSRDLEKLTLDEIRGLALLNIRDPGQCLSQYFPGSRIYPLDMKKPYSIPTGVIPAKAGIHKKVVSFHWHRMDPRVPRLREDGDDTKKRKIRCL